MAIDFEAMEKEFYLVYNDIIDGEGLREEIRKDVETLKLMSNEAINVMLDNFKSTVIDYRRQVLSNYDEVYEKMLELYLKEYPDENEDEYDEFAFDNYFSSHDKEKYSVCDELLEEIGELDDTEYYHIAFIDLANLFQLHPILVEYLYDIKIKEKNN
jgi:hypothetical protein